MAEEVLEQRAPRAPRAPPAAEEEPVEEQADGTEPEQADGGQQEDAEVEGAKAGAEEAEDEPWRRRWDGLG